MLRRARRPAPPTASRSHRRLPRPKWVLIIAVFGMFLSVLVTNGLISSEIGVDATGAGPDGPDNGVPAVISDGGPVIDLTSGRLDSLVMPPKTVALTFDDGPDPEWTPQVLAELAKYHVHRRVGRQPPPAHRPLDRPCRIGPAGL